MEMQCVFYFLLVLSCFLLREREKEKRKKKSLSRKLSSCDLSAPLFFLTQSDCPVSPPLIAVCYAFEQSTGLEVLSQRKDKADQRGLGIASV